MEEKNLKSRNAERIPCDFCSEETAVLYCRADSAKLCLFCDLHVHSANDLSRKHVRSQICDNCGSEPVTARCATDNLVLCQECDWDAHGNCSASASHERSPVEGFSGCPSPLDLASTFGFDVEDKKSLVPTPAVPPLQSVNSVNSMFSNWSTLDSVLSADSWGFKSAEMSFQDLMVPGDNANVPFSEIPALLKRQNPSCGKQRQVIFKQLVEMMKRDLSLGDGGTETDLGPGTPGRSVRQGSFEGGDGGDGANQLLQQQTPYTSLLISAVCGDLRENERVVDDDGLLDSNPRSRQSRQIWDFHSGRSRNHEVPSQLDIGYSTTDAGFMIENYSDLIESGSMEATKVLEDIYQMNCSTTHEDIKSQNNNSNNPALSQRPGSSESNNLTTIRSSSGFSLATSKATSNTKDVNLMDQVHPVGGESPKVTTKASMELLAQNRGNAMLRYKEKKKTRRYDKHIRYESRKARADTRKRVKGRFVKASEAPDISSSR